MDVDEFKRQYPDARVTDFTEEDRRVAKDWLQDKQVLMAEYWRVEVTREWNRRKTRQVEKKKVVQYITNGIEILESNPQPGTIIPVIPFIGLERWIDEGAGPVRKLFSLVRIARDPQMCLAYLCSLEMEEAGLTPKSAYLGYVGQFETDKEGWDTATKIPHPYLQVDPIPDCANGTILPLPQRDPVHAEFSILRTRERCGQARGPECDGHQPAADVGAAGQPEVRCRAREDSAVHCDRQLPFRRQLRARTETRGTRGGRVDPDRLRHGEGSRDSACRR